MAPELRVIFANTKKINAWEFFMVQIFYSLEMDHLSSSSNSQLIHLTKNVLKCRDVLESYPRPVKPYLDFLSYQPPPLACRCLAHTIMRVFFLSGHSIETLGMKYEVGILRISKLCTEQYFLIFIISIIKLRSSVITNLRVLLTASISLLFLPFEVDGYR